MLDRRTHRFCTPSPRDAARVGLCASVCERARPLRPPSRALERDVISHHLGERPRAPPQRSFAGQHRLRPPARRYGHCHRRAARRVRCCPFATLVPREPAPDRPSCLPAAARSLASRRPAPVRAPWTRQTARAGGLVSTLTPRRAVRRRSSTLSG